MAEFGKIEDGFGNCWARCKEDCGLEVVRPGKVQCECDSVCLECGGEYQYFGIEDSPFEGISGYLCVTCTEKWAGPRRVVKTKPLDEQMEMFMLLPPFEDYEPCDHPGCLQHISHPCEGCGRIGGQPLE